MDFMNKVCKVSNKNHNPFKTVVNRLSFFLKQNNVTAAGLLKRLAASNPSTTSGAGNTGISIEVFATFLKQKVEKKRAIEDLRQYASMLDVDKDSQITEADITTCIKNLNNAAFWRNGGLALSRSTFNTSTKFYPV